MYFSRVPLVYHIQTRLWGCRWTNLRRSTPRRCRRKSMVLLAVIEWAGCRFTEQKVCETSFSQFFLIMFSSCSHDVHIIFTDPWPTLWLCHAVPRFEVSGKFLELAPSTSLGFWRTSFHIVPGDDITWLQKSSKHHSDQRWSVSMWNVSRGFSLGPLCYYGCYGCFARTVPGDAPGHSGKRGRNRCGDPNGSQDPGRVTWIDVNRCESMWMGKWKDLMDMEGTLMVLW